MTKKQLLTTLLEEVKAKKILVELEQPTLRQYENRDSAPYFCDLCFMSEMDIMERKSDDGKYYCGCSYWSDPHNAYLDKSGGNWLGWFDKEEAQRFLEGLPTEGNTINRTIDEVSTLIKKRLQTIRSESEGG